MTTRPRDADSRQEFVGEREHRGTLLKVGVVSDTHLPRFGRRLPRALVDGLRSEGVELILHLGDMTTFDVPALFEEIAPFDAVGGNNDPAEIQARFGRRKIVNLAGLRVGMIHGDGERGTTLSRVLAAFAGEHTDAILFGHSHIPYRERHGETWVINPGSPTDKRRQPRYSYAVLEIARGVLLPTLHFYDDRR